MENKRMCDCERPENIVRIVIDGPQIQGVTLREEIKEKADFHKVKGFVENLKNRKTVEIICINDGENFDKFVEDLNKLKKDDKFKINDIKVHDHFLDADDFKIVFEIRREDDLQEMVWALQGAGKMFEIAEKRRVKNQIKTLTYSLIYGLSEITDWLNSKKIVPLEPIALNNFLINFPADNEQGLMENLYTIKSEILELNHLINGKDEVGAKTKIETLREKRFEGDGIESKLTYFELIDHIIKKLKGDGVNEFKK